MKNYEKVLENGEKIRLVVKRNYLYTLQRMFLMLGWLPVLLAIGGTVAFFGLEAIELIWWIVSLVLAVLIALSLLYATTREWYNTSYVVTNRRVFRQRGSKVYSLSYDNIRGIRVKTCPWNEDKGSVRFKGKDVDRLDHFNFISEINHVSSVILNEWSDSTNR